MNKPLYHITHSGVISLAFDGRSVTIQTDFPNYALIREAIDNKNWEVIPDLVDVQKAVQKHSKGKVTIDANDTVRYEGRELHNAMTDRLLFLMRNSYPIDSFILFMENVMENTSHTAVEELYLFLTKNDIPITTDGCFLAYKKVSPDFKSIHASPDGTHLDHSIGAVVTMPRNEVNENRNQTCSTGLHCCSQSYLPKYANGGSNRVVIVKVHPKDVVTIPSDYNNAKMRACGYTVVKEHLDGQHVSAFKKPLYDTSGNEVETIADMMDKIKSRVVEIIDSFFRPKVRLDYRDSFFDYGISKAQILDLMLEIEEELNLEVQDGETDHISPHTPIVVLRDFYELAALKSVSKKKQEKNVAPLPSKPAPNYGDLDDEDLEDDEDEDEDLCPECGEDQDYCSCGEDNEY